MYRKGNYIGKCHTYPPSNHNTTEYQILTSTPTAGIKTKNDEIDTPLDKFKEVREIPQLFFAHLSLLLYCGTQTVTNCNRKPHRARSRTRLRSYKSDFVQLNA